MPARRGEAPRRERSKSPETCWRKPLFPSKDECGPLTPARASRQANRPLRQALADAMPFHIESSPKRVCPSAQFAVAAKLTVSRSAFGDSPSALPEPRAAATDV